MFYDAIDDFMMNWNFSNYFLLLQQTFRWGLSPSPCSFLFALHLDWSLNTSVHKKIKCSLYIWELAFHFISSVFFFTFVLFFVGMHKRGKKLTETKLIVDSFSNMQSEFSDVNLCNLTESGGPVPSSFINKPPLKWSSCIFQLPIFITTPLPATQPPF